MARKGETISEETREKMRAAHERRWRAKRSVYLQACNYIHIGSKRSKATRQRMSEAHTGRQHSPETIEKIRQAALKRS